MNRTFFCVLLLGLLMGCNNTKPTSSGPPVEPGISLPASSAISGKPNYLGTTLKARATVESGNRPDSSHSDRLFLNRDGTRLALSLGKTEKTQIWDMSGEPKKLFEQKGRAQAFSPDGKLYLRSGADKPEIVNAESGAVVSTLQYEGTRDHAAVHFRTPEVLIGAMFANRESGKPGELIISEFNTGTGQVTASFKVAYEARNPSIVFGGMDGVEVVVGDSKTKKVQFWNTITQKPSLECLLAEAMPDSHWSYFYASFDGKWLTAQTAKAIEIFDTKTGAAVSIVPKEANGARLCPTGDLFAAHMVFGDEKYNVHQGYVVYNIHRKEHLAFLPSSGLALTFSADGKVAVNYTKSGELQVWDMTQLAGK